MAVVAVTGAAGFVGARLMPTLAARGHQPVGIVRSGAQSGLRTVGVIDGQTDWTAALRGVEVIVHCAARAHVMQERSADPVAAYREVNVEGTRRLAKEAARAGVRRLVFLSSVKAVSERSSRGCPLRASDLPRPEDAYGVSKLEAEHALADIGASTGLETVIVRPPLVYGPGVKGNFVRLMSLVARGVPLPLGAIDNARSLTAIGNLADFICACVESPAAAGKTFFVSDGDDLSTASLVRRIGLAMGRPAHVLPIPEYLLDALGRLTGKSAEVERLIGTLQVDISLNREVLGWVPPVTVDAALQETVAWFGRRV